MDKNIAGIRRVYDREKLDESSAGSNPYELFTKWFEEAVSSDILDPTAFTLATSGKDHVPDARVVLLKEFNTNGFVFFTNYESKKGNDLLQNPHCTALFFWPPFERQVRIQGITEKINKEESQEYFQSRPREAQIGSWVSNQSKKIMSREELEKKYLEYESKFKDKKIPMPEYWGGYMIKPSYFEFWQGRPSRLHDRITFTWKEDQWQRDRLEP